MARTGNFGGFYFDEEVFTDMMQEQDTWNNAIIASGIVAKDQSIMDSIGTKGNVATIPMYRPLNIEDEGMEPLNNDGKTNNTPVEVKGNKQTCMLIQRMKAFQAKDFTKELTGADPMNNIKSKIAGYYQQVWERDLMTIADTMLSLEGLAEHVTDLSTAGSSVTDANKIADTTLIYAQQKALGDMADGFGLYVINSYIYARYKALGLVDYDKYTVKDALGRDVSLPTIGGLIPLVTDRYTVDTSGSFPVYKSYIFGEGAFLEAEKNNYENQYTTDYDPETNAGTDKFYTKQGKVLHPNGVSIKADNIAEESPTTAELGTAKNWELKFNHKNVRMGLIKSNG